MIIGEYIMNDKKNRQKVIQRRKRIWMGFFIGIIGIAALLYNSHLFQEDSLKRASASQKEEDIQETLEIKNTRRELLETAFFGILIGSQRGNWKQESTKIVTTKEDKIDEKNIEELEEELGERIEKVVFIGNSMIEGLQEHNKDSKANFLCYHGLAVNSAMKKDWITLKNGEKGTVLDALKEESYTDIFMMFGVNELGWKSLDIFRDYYIELIEEVKKLQPDAAIYVQSILPVTKRNSEIDKVYNNDNVNKFNAVVIEVAKETQVTYLDLGTVLCGEGNPLPEDAAIRDGVHLKKEYCQKWYKYILEILCHKM